MSPPRTRLVLADDHLGIATVLGQLLERDYDVVATVRDGLELVEVAIRLRPEVIVADMNMPSLSGLDALRRLQRQEIRIKFVLLTTDGDPALAAETFRAGGSAYLLKHRPRRNCIRRSRKCSGQAVLDAADCERRHCGARERAVALVTAGGQGLCLFDGHRGRDEAPAIERCPHRRNQSLARRTC